MDFRVPNQVTYDFEGRATVAEVAKALIAQEQLLRDALLVIEGCYSEIEIEHVSVTVREVVQNSPLRHRIEGFIVAALSPGLTEDMPADILDTLFGLDVPDSYDGFVTLLVLIVSLWGAEKVIQQLKRSKDDAEGAELERRETEIAAERKRLTEKAAIAGSVEEDRLQEAISTTLQKRAVSVGRSAMNFLSPARRHRAVAIRAPGGEAIEKETIDALPSDLEMASYEPATETTPYERVIVKFHAHDKDNPKRWAGTISEVGEGRKALHISPDIDSESLFTREKVRADVLVTSVLDAQGEYQPSIYYLARVYDDEAA